LISVTGLGSRLTVQVRRTLRRTKVVAKTQNRGLEGPRASTLVALADHAP